MTLELVSQTHSELGEGPVWHNGEFYWIDITGKKVNTINKKGEESVITNTPSFVGCAVPSNDDSFYLGLEDGIYHYENGHCQPAGNFKIMDPALRFNDGKCDVRGRLWLGTMDKENEQAPIGSLYVFDCLQSVTQVLAGVTVSNGLCWNAEETKFYYIDSPSREIVSFNYNPEKLTLSNRNVVFKIASDAYPDGMTIDEEGMLWVALWDGYAVIRINPHNGDLLETVDIPCKKVTSACFGGEHLDELYITTASLDMSENDWKMYPNSGCCFKYRPGVKGFSSNTFCVE